MRNIRRASIFLLFCVAVPCLIISIYQYRASGMVAHAANDFIEINKDAADGNLITQSREKLTSPTNSGVNINNDAKATFATLSSGLQNSAVVSGIGWGLVLILGALLLLLDGKKVTPQSSQ